MTQAAAQEQKVEQSVSLAALFTAFLIVSLCGIGGGGGIVWARRIAVEKRRWISDGEFADIVSLCQFMPGPKLSALPSASGRRCGARSGQSRRSAASLSSRGLSAS